MRKDYIKQAGLKDFINPVKFIIQADYPDLEDSDYEEYQTYVVISDRSAIITVFSEEVRGFWRHSGAPFEFGEGTSSMPSSMPTLMLNKA